MLHGEFQVNILNIFVSFDDTFEDVIFGGLKNTWGMWTTLYIFTKKHQKCTFDESIFCIDALFCLIDRYMVVIDSEKNLKLIENFFINLNVD